MQCIFLRQRFTITTKPDFARLTSGPIRQTLITLTIPMIFGILGIFAFNLIDTFFVGQLGAAELAAMSFTFPVVMIIGSISMGLGVGASAVISRAIGEGNVQKVQHLTSHSLILGILIVACFAVIGLLTIDPVFRLMGATDEVMPLIRSYMDIWYLGVVFIVIPMIGNNAIRAKGDTKTPSAIMLTAMTTNLVLDPILIFGLGPIPRMELPGAALATVLARATTLVASLGVLYFREKMIILTRPQIRDLLQSWKQVLYIGIPTAGTNIIMPISLGVITRLVSTYGPESVAALGVASRIEGFGLTPIMALGSVLGPFVGQNWGAGNKKRMELGVQYSHQFGLAWGTLVFILLAILARPIAGLFSDNPIVIETTALYLWLVPVSYGLAAVLVLSTTALNVLNKPLHSAVLMILRMVVLYIPLAYLGSYFLGIAGIFGAGAAASAISGLVASYWLKQKILPRIKTDSAKLP